eukprot:GHVS01028462.1.p1 GENE.GHVS01028462.1~~GHVS01028462.1.p1  ORF type:complete len:132 (+),score=28.20 GHVS01028462.1:93-488(+)
MVDDLSGGKNSSALIQLLLQAEERAEAIVAKAREDAVRKRRDARASAEEESSVYRQKEEELFQEEFKKKYGNNDSEMNAIEEMTARDLSKVKEEYLNNRDEVIEFNKKCATQIDLTLSTRQAKLIAQIENK